MAFFPHGAMGVEFFFLLTGIFLAQSLDKQLQRAEKKTNAFADTGRYFWKKYSSTFPQHLVAFVVLFGVTVLAHLNDAGWSAWERFKAAIPSLFLIQMTGIRGKPLNHIEWYLSSMLIAILIVYFLCRLNFKVVTRYVAPVISVLLLLWMWRSGHSLTGVTKEMKLFSGMFIYKGNIRAIAEIFLGAFVYSFGKYGLTPLGEKTGKAVRMVLTALEWLMYGGAVVITILTVPYRYEFLALAFILGGVILSFSGLTYSGKLFDNAVCYFLGKITLPVYLSQLAAITTGNYYLKHYSVVMRVWGILVLTAVSSAVTMLAGDALAGIFTRKKKEEKAAA